MIIFFGALIKDWQFGLYISNLTCDFYFHNVDLSCYFLRVTLTKTLIKTYKTIDTFTKIEN